MFPPAALTCRSRRRCVRRGATLAEFAIVSPVCLFLMFAILVGGLGAFRCQQVAAIAREASRWASVHGAKYAEDSGEAAATGEDIYQEAIVPMAQGLDLKKLTYSVSWDSSNNPQHTVLVNGQPAFRNNTVTVTVNYQWTPEFFLTPRTFTSTSVATMSY